jgi:hypothetical protein
MIIISMTLMLFASCQSSGENGNDGTTSSPQNTGDPNANAAGEEADSEDTKILPDLPETDFGGLELTFMSRLPNEFSNVSKQFSEAASLEETGELMNDAVYRRNRYVEAKYNVSINRILSADSGSLLSDIKKAVDAGDNSFDAAFASLNDGANLSLQNYYIDLNTVPNLDFTKPWWDQRAAQNLSIGGKLYFVTGDITPWTYEFPTSVIVNNDMIEKYALENPYKVVREDRWTYDKLSEYIKAVSADLNGNGITDIDDSFGLTLANETYALLFVGGGENFTQKDSDDLPYFALNNERAVNVAEKLYNIFADTNSVLIREKYENMDWEDLRTNFRKGNTLFYATWMSAIVLFRDLDASIGLLPQPKYDSTQETYSHPISDYWASVVVIPQTNTKLSETGFILEALCAESMYTVRPAYFENTFTTKALRDEDSEEMLDIILNSMTYDLGRTFNWGGIVGTLTSIGLGNSFNYSSVIESNTDKVNAAIQTAVDTFNSQP